MFICSITFKKYFAQKNELSFWLGPVVCSWSHARGHTVPQVCHGLARVRTCIERVFAAACTGGACECLTERQFVKEIGSVREVALRVFFFVGTKTNIRVSPPPRPRAHKHAVDTSACCASRRSFAAVKMLGQSVPLFFLTLCHSGSAILLCTNECK
jgi:hypothetical protein